MKIDNKSRRMFLQGLGGFTLAVPFLPSILPRAAAQVPPPKRFIALKSWSGQLHTRWYPSRPTPGYTLRGPFNAGTRQDGTLALNNVIPGTGYMKWAPLQDFAINGQGISDIIDNKFNSLLPKMMLIKGLDFHMDCNHNGGGYLGNFAECIGPAKNIEQRPTIDQLMAYSSNFYSGGVPAHRFLAMASRNDIEGYACTASNFGDPGRAITLVRPDVNPTVVFNRLFGSGSGGGGGGSGNDPNVPLLNLVMEDFRRVRNGRRISSEDGTALDNFMDRLSDLINSLSGSGGGGGGVGSCNTNFNVPDYENGMAYGPGNEWMARSMVNIALAAIQCGLTNIVSINVNSGWIPQTGTGTPHIDAPGQWHAAAHSWNPNMNDSDMVMLYRINKWIADDVFYRLANELNQMQDTDGSPVLDNSLVYWGNETGFGHNNTSVPAITAGGAGGYFNTGRYYDYINYGYSTGTFGFDGGFQVPGIAHNRFLVAVLQSMGVPQSEYEQHNRGEQGYGSHSTQGYSPAQLGSHPQWNLSGMRNPPPGMVG